MAGPRAAFADVNDCRLSPGCPKIGVDDLYQQASHISGHEAE
jgi:hypothetical protein